MTHVEHVEVLVEEPSAEAALTLLLPRILGSTTFQIHPQTSKQKLLKNLPGRLRGYARWLPKTHRVLVVIDRDSDDCAALKAKLEQMASNAGLTTRTASHNGNFHVVNRIAIEELEAWFFGDWAAVRKAYPKATKSIPSDKRYRIPDSIQGGTWEALERELQKVGYFETGLRKIDAARSIARFMDPSRNTSQSFCALRDALLEMAT